jgi:hypothetical protein
VFVDLGDTDKMTEERERETGAGVHGGQLRAEGARTARRPLLLPCGCAVLLPAASDHPLVLVSLLTLLRLLNFMCSSMYYIYVLKLTNHGIEIDVLIS